MRTQRSVKRRALPLNRRLRGNGITLLSLVPDGAAALVVFDPQYRGVLDKLKYGNEGARQIERARLPQMSDGDIRFFLSEAARALAPSGHVLLWVDKFTIASAHHQRWLQRLELETVDLIAWDKCRFGMGRRARCQTEYLMVLQKPPVRAKGVWTDARITDSWSEHHDRSVHPHAKPRSLTERLVRATTRRGDLVIDPCAGGFGVLDACLRSGRDFLGCDLVTGEELL